MRIRKSRQPMRDPFKNWSREQFLEQERIELEQAKQRPQWAALHYTNAANWRQRADQLKGKTNA